jgi:hypothetical protein
MRKSDFKITRVSGMPVGNEDLIADLQRVAYATGKGTVGQKEYRVIGTYDDTTVSDRFGSWNKALIAANLNIANEVNIQDEQLFENLLILWQHYGRQPRRSELATAPSKISQSPYIRRFSSWTAALEVFVKYANDSGTDFPVGQVDSEVARRTTSRDPSLRLRWRVLQRDRFTCRACGKSPALTPGVELHVDHITPWSKGGETVLENLQTLCSVCNLGKSNVNEG